MRRYPVGMASLMSVALIASLAKQRAAERALIVPQGHPDAVAKEPGPMPPQDRASRRRLLKAERKRAR